MNVSAEFLYHATCTLFLWNELMMLLDRFSLLHKYIYSSKIIVFLDFSLEKTSS